jgi:hypothetical protein
MPLRIVKRTIFELNMEGYLETLFAKRSVFGLRGGMSLIPLVSRSDRAPLSLPELVARIAV